MNSLFEQNGGTYRFVNGYGVPNLTLPDDESEYTLGRWGRQRLSYLKQHRRVLYVNLLTSRLTKPPLVCKNCLLSK